MTLWNYTFSLGFTVISIYVKMEGKLWNKLNPTLLIGKLLFLCAGVFLFEPLAEWDEVLLTQFILKPYKFVFKTFVGF